MKAEERFRFLFVIFVVIVMATVCAGTALVARPSGGPAGTSCNNCHGATQNDAALTIAGVPANYTPGKKYSITIGISGSTGNGPFGFQVWAHTAGGAQSGTLAPGTGSGFSPGSPLGGVVYVGHTSPGCAGSASCSWTVSWTAPSTSTDTTIIDAQGVQSFSLYAQQAVTSDPAAATPPPPQFAASNPVSPNSGSTSGGTPVTINGSNFVTGAIVFFSNTAGSTTFVSSTQLTAVSPPAAAAGVVTLKVQNPDGQSATLPGAFTYTQATAPAPQFAASNPIAPNSGSTSGGTSVTINGSNFVTGAIVSFGNIAGSTTFVSSTQLTVVSPPAAAAGVVTLKVQNPDGQSATLPGAFTYTQASAPAPQFSASNPLSPSSGSTSGGTAVTVNGSNFVSGTAVIFGSTAGATTFVNSSQLTAISPPAPAPGAVTVKVQNPDGQSATLPGGFTYTQTTTPSAPQFAASNPVFPSSGSMVGGMTVTLNGANFINGAVAFFGTTPATTQFVSATQLMAVAPPAAVPGAVSIKIQNPDGQSATLPGAFEYTQTPAPPPQFAASNASAPHIGPMTGGTVVAIAGSNFLSGAVVYFGAIPGTRTQFISTTQLLATAPPVNSAGTFGLQVRNPDGQTATLPASFTYYEDSLKVAYAIASGGVANSKSNRESGALSAPAGGGIFTFSHNGTLVTTVGTAAATPTTSMLMFADSKPLQTVNGGLLNNTGVAILNGTASTANLSFTLLNPDGTRSGTPVAAQLYPGSHFQGFITDSNLFGSRANNFTGTLRVDSSQPISALTLQQTTNQAPRYESLLTSTPVADFTHPSGNGNLVFAQLPDGGGFQTRIVLLNTNSLPISGRILFYRDDSGSSKSDMMGSDPFYKEIPYFIQPGGEFSMLTDGSGGLHVGFAMVVPDSGDPLPVGTGMFIFTQGSFTVNTTGVPASPATGAGLIFVNTSPTSKGLAQNTGVAIVNPSATEAIDIVFKLRDMAGNVIATRSFSQMKGAPLKPRGHMALFVNELFGTSANNFTGTMSLETSSAEGLSALTLLQTTNERTETLFTTLPVAGNVSFSGPLFFPQLVSGGGYETQLVLLNPSSLTFTGSVSFFSGFEWNNGAPVAMPLNDSISTSFQYAVPSQGGAIFK